MSKADVLNLVQTLCNGSAEPTSIDRYYDDICYELARENWFTDASLIALTRGQVEVDLNAAIGVTLVNRLGVIYDDAEIEEVPKRLMESIDPQWRDAVRYTRSYVTEDENAKMIALHPAPFVASNPDLGVFGEPMGMDYPTYNLALFYSYAPLSPQTMFYYIELVAALRIIALEFQRESDHTDVEFAQASQALLNLMKSLLT